MPFESINELFNAWKDKMNIPDEIPAMVNPPIWVKMKEFQNMEFMITGYDKVNHGVFVNGQCYTLQRAYQKLLFKDGTIFGKNV